MKIQFILYLLIIYCSLGHSKDEIPKVVEIAKAEYSSIQQTIRVIGTIEAKRSIIFVARASGTLECCVPSGKEVTKDTLVMKVENADTEKTCQLAQAAEKIAATQYKRIVSLNKNKTSSQQEVEEKYRVLVESQKALATAKIAFDQTCFKAPFTGVVGTHKMREGAQVQINDKLVAFYDPTQLIVTFDIPESALKNISAYAVIDKKNFSLNVQKIIDPDTHMAPAFVEFSGNDCVIGSNVYVTLNLKKKDNALVIPEEAVFFFRGEPHVYVVKHNKTKLTPISIGIREKGKIEVTEGLKKDDVYVRTAPQRLYPDCTVQIA